MEYNTIYDLEYGITFQALNTPDGEVFCITDPIHRDVVILDPDSCRRLREIIAGRS